MMKYTSFLSLAAAKVIYDQEDIDDFIKSATLTCSSMIRLKNMDSGMFLYSTNMNIQGGSGQNLVTCMPEDDDE